MTFSNFSVRAGCRLAFVAAFLATIVQPVFAQADGPDYFRIVGSKKDESVTVRRAPNANAKAVGTIAKDADGVKNLGCKGGLTEKQWAKANEKKRKAAARNRWCEVEFEGVKGWVSGRFLAEGSAPTPQKPAEKTQTLEPQTNTAPPLIAPSFDCIKAEKYIEKLVCADAGLAGLDREVARLYALASEALNATPGFEELLDGQKKWQLERNTCFDADCAAEMYVRRVHQLRQGSADARKEETLSKSIGPLVLRCENFDALIGMTLVNTEPAYAYLEWRDKYLVLKQMKTGSGIRYEGSFATLQAKGEEATLKIPADDNEKKCKVEKGG